MVPIRSFLPFSAAELSDELHNILKELTEEHRQTVIDQFWMQKALILAQQAAECDEVPVGALVIRENELLAAAGNGVITSSDPTAHAEILALRLAAGKLANYRLPETTLYVTLEPCLMCMGAMIHSRVSRLVYGAHDPKTGAANSVYQVGSDGRLNHTLTIRGGILADECGTILRDFFRKKRKKG